VSGFTRCNLSRERVKTYCLAALWFIGASVPLAGLLTPIAIGDRDFANYWLAGSGFRAGVDIYDPAALRAFSDASLNAFLPNFTYPPPLLFLLVPLSFLPPYAAYLFWVIATGALFYIAARQHIPDGFPAVLVLLTPAALININFGQTSFLVGALWLFAFNGSGMSAAFLTIKPHMGFLVAFRILIDARAVVVGAITVLAMVLLSALVFGGWAQFLAHAFRFQGEMMVSSPHPFWYRQMVAPSTGYGMLGWVLFAAAAAYLLWRAYNVFTAATATLLMSPYALHYDMTVACLGFAVLLHSQWDRMTFYQRSIIALGFLVPVTVRFGTWFAPPVLLLALKEQVELNARDVLAHSRRTCAAS